MPFWVHGRDSQTGENRDSLFIDVSSESEARAIAAEAGLTVDEVDYVDAAAANEPPPGTFTGKEPPNTTDATGSDLMTPVPTPSRNRRITIVLAAGIIIGSIGLFPPLSNVNKDGSVNHRSVGRGFLLANWIPQSRVPLPELPWGDGRPLPSEANRRSAYARYERQMAASVAARRQQVLGRSGRHAIDIGRMLGEIFVVAGVASTAVCISLLREDKVT